MPVSEPEADGQVALGLDVPRDRGVLAGIELGQEQDEAHVKEVGLTSNPLPKVSVRVARGEVGQRWTTAGGHGGQRVFAPTVLNP
eukprot:7384548-Heterocapsa_arctica.AAC.1